MKLKDYPNKSKTTCFTFKDGILRSFRLYYKVYGGVYVRYMIGICFPNIYLVSNPYKQRG